MEVSPAIIVDILLLAVVVFSVIFYVRKGFAAGVIALVGNLVSLVFAWIVSGRLSPTVFENFFKSNLIERTAHAIQEQGGVNLTAILNDLTGILPQSLIDKIAASAAGILDSNAPDIAHQIVEKVIAPLLVPLISVVVFFAAFALCRVLAGLLVAILTNLNKIPLIGSVNRLFGAVVGLAAGLIYVLMILCLLWAAVLITNGNISFLNDEVLSGSYFYSFFSAYNPFV